ncbi:MAG: PEP-CTERM sorting domain-containing protein [Phycisphaeraceae bacterium]
MSTRSFIPSLAFILALCFGHSAAQAVLHIVAAPGYTITWNGNDGANFSPANPALVPANLATGATPIANSQFGANHLIVKINDGHYGNFDSWIANAVDVNNPNPGIGVVFAGLQNVTSVAWGRDNGNAVTDPTSGGQPVGQLSDRSLGTYTLQRTTLAAPSAATAVTGNATTGWETIGTFAYNGSVDNPPGGGFTAFLRHEYQIAFLGGAVDATAIRITAPNGNAIDEIEAYSGSIQTGIRLVSISAPVTVADNLALSSRGSVAFAKDLIGNGSLAPTHTIANLNDGIYGNSNSWIGNSNPTFAGVALGSPTLIGAIAFGRDSDGVVSFADRAAGVYILQYTTVLNPDATTPDSDWITLGSTTYATNDPLRFIRHQYAFDPVFATGIRIVTQNGEGQIAIDEIEVIGVPEPATASLLVLGVAGLVARRRRVQ